MRSFLVVSVCSILAASLAVPAAADCVFVNQGTSPNTVEALQVGSGGALTAASGSPFATNGGNQGQGLVIVGSRLYAVNTFPPGSGLRSQDKGINPGTISGFTIGPGCSLALLAGSPWSTGGALPAGVAANPAGTRLVIGNSNDGTIMVLDIAADGSLAPVAGAPFAAEPGPADLQIAPDGARLFVSQGGAGLGVYDIAGNGALTEVAGSPFAAGGSPFFKGNKLTPSGARFYAMDNMNSQAAGFSVGAGGVLSALPGSPYGSGAGPDDIALSPDASHLFAGDFDGGTVSVFAVAGDGSLAEIAGSPFASDGPSGLVLNPAGTTLYALASTGSAIYQIDAYTVSSAGALTPLAGSPFATGSLGTGTRLVYFPQSVVTEIPALDMRGLAALATLLVLAAARILERRRAPVR
jgi:DNA-binding beta-propeller fold protein YncE